MIDSEEGDGKIASFGPSEARGEKLPYKIELWNLQRSEVEKVLARAASAALGRAIFLAARQEHLGRYITLRKGSKLVAESA